MIERQEGGKAEEQKGRQEGSNLLLSNLLPSALPAFLPFCLSAFLVSACVQPARRPPNILLITLDTTRADRLGAYGYRAAATPRLDRLAREGVLFERAVAAAPITLPAHVSLLTASYPFAHGVRNNGNFSLNATTPTLAAALHDRGYATAAFVSAFVLDRRYGLARGFDEYDDRLQLERRGDRTAAAAAAWIETHATGAAPFFAWLHLYDPHDPYEPPPPFRERFAASAYDGEIAFVDEVVGSILDRLERAGRLASTIVAVVGDHGESLGEHGEDTHGVFVYEATMRVPMILSWPGQLPAGRRVGALVRAIDLAPTLLDLAGQPPLSGAQGQSMLPLVHDAGASAAPVSAYGETYFPLLYMNWAPLRSIQDERWKFIDAPVPELYDLQRDPAELSNVAARESSRAAALSRALDALTGGRTGPMSAQPVDSETAAKLAALGYVGASNRGTKSTPTATRPDPKQMIGVFNAVRRANAAVEHGRFDEGAAMARTALVADPANAFARLVLANAAMGQRRYRDAIESYRAYLDAVPESADAHHRVSIAYARLGDGDHAMAEEDVAISIDPRHADAHGHRGSLLAERGRLDEGIRDLRIAVDALPDNVPYRVGLAHVLIKAHRLDEAQRELDRAVQLQPDSADVQAGFGSLFAARGQHDSAVAAFRRALAAMPDADDIRLDLAAALDAAGRRAEARVEYQRLVSARETPDVIKSAAKARLR
jgi:choline-sulfatase